jgi:hypothetical protein
MTYRKPQILAQNSAQGVYAAGCAQSSTIGGGCCNKDCAIMG